MAVEGSVQMIRRIDSGPCMDAKANMRITELILNADQHIRTNREILAHPDTPSQLRAEIARNLARRHRAKKERP